MSLAGFDFLCFWYSSADVPKPPHNTPTVLKPSPVTPPILLQPSSPLAAAAAAAAVAAADTNVSVIAVDEDAVPDDVVNDDVSTSPIYSHELIRYICAWSSISFSRLSVHVV